MEGRCRILISLIVRCSKSQFLKAKCLCGTLGKSYWVQSWKNCTPLPQWMCFPWGQTYVPFDFNPMILCEVYATLYAHIQGCAIIPLPARYWCQDIAKFCDIEVLLILQFSEFDYFYWYWHCKRTFSIIIIGIDVARSNQQVSILILVLQSKMRGMFFWNWYCRMY